MDSTQIIDAIASCYGVQKTVRKTFVGNYPAVFLVIRLQRGVSLCDRCFTSIIGGVPSGYKREEAFFYKEFSSMFNDSYSDAFLDYAYDIVEPKLKQKYHGIPIFFENIYGKVCMCTMMNLNSFVMYGSVNRIEIDRSVDIFDLFFQDADRMINCFYD